MSQRVGKQENIQKRFGSERDVAILTGLSARTLQKDRLLGSKRLPYYRLGGRILYDLVEVERIIRATVTGAAT